MNFELFSEKTIDLLRNAHKKARILKFEDVGTDHLLLALTEEIELFEKAGYNPWLIHREVSMLLGEGETTEEPSTYTPRAKQVIEHSLAQMNETGHEKVYPAHILMSLLSETKGVAIRALHNLNIDPNEFKEKIAKQIQDTTIIA